MNDLGWSVLYTILNQNQNRVYWTSMWANTYKEFDSNQLCLSSTTVYNITICNDTIKSFFILNSCHTRQGKYIKCNDWTSTLLYADTTQRGDKQMHEMWVLSPTLTTVWFHHSDLMQKLKSGSFLHLFVYPRAEPLEL